MSKDIEIQTLACLLSREEVEDRAGRLAAANQSAVELDNEKKQVTAQFSAKEKAISAEIVNLSNQVASKKEYRQIECEWDFDWTEGVKRLYRTDTSEIIDTRKIKESERQARIDE